MNWTVAGLLPEAPQTADFVYDITQQTGANWDAKLNTAIQQAKNDNGVSIIYFPAGTYRFYSPVELTQVDGSNTIFQGAGSNSTVLEFQIGSSNKCFWFHGSRGGNAKIVTSNILKGSKTIYANNFSSNFVTGDWIHFYENNFPYVESNYGYGAVGQITRLESVSGNYGTIKDDASKSYSTGYDLKVEKIYPIKNVGIEKLKIKRLDTGNSSTGDIVRLEYAVNCWIKGVESEFTCHYHVFIARSSHIKVSGSYFHEARKYNNAAGGRGYGIGITLASTNCLFENNIFKKLRHAMAPEGGANCNVFIYNYSREQYSTELRGGIEVPWPHADLNIHGNYPYANLFEENWVEKIEADDYNQENGPYNTFIRNLSLDHNGNKHQMILDDCPNTNVLGCELLGDETYSPIIIGGNSSLSTDLYGVYVDQNHTYSTGTMVAHQELFTHNFIHVIDDISLQDISYYYSQQPDFLSPNYTFPSLGPNPAPSIQYLPAKDRYNSSNKTYCTDPTQWPQPSLSVNISGPTHLNTHETGTFTANPSGGSGIYPNYRWWTRNDESGGFGAANPPPGPLAPPSGYWIYMSSWEGQQTVQKSCTYDFSLKCEVTDSDNNTAIDIHSVTVGSELSPDVAQQTQTATLNSVPTKLTLVGNYPNPFNPNTTIRFGLPENQRVQLTIYSITGEKVAVPVNSVLQKGFHSLQWNGRNQNGNPVSTGIYIYELVAKDRRIIKKMLLAK